MTSDARERNRLRRRITVSAEHDRRIGKVILQAIQQNLQNLLVADAQTRENKSDFRARRFFQLLVENERIGDGHREATAEYKRPLAVMREYLDGLDAAPQPVAPEHRCIAALGPKMLDLAAERTLGTHPYFVPPAHTRASQRRCPARRHGGGELRGARRAQHTWATSSV